MSFFLFQAGLAAYLLAAAAYLVFFLTSRNEVRRIAHGIFLAAVLLHTVNIVARYVEAGHTPITSHHETVSFFVTVSIVLSTGLLSEANGFIAARATTNSPDVIPPSTPPASDDSRS